MFEYVCGRNFWICTIAFYSYGIRIYWDDNTSEDYLQHFHRSTEMVDIQCRGDESVVVRTPRWLMVVIRWDFFFFFDLAMNLNCLLNDHSIITLTTRPLECIHSICVLSFIVSESGVVLQEEPYIHSINQKRVVQRQDYRRVYLLLA